MKANFMPEKFDPYVISVINTLLNLNKRIAIVKQLHRLIFFHISMQTRLKVVCTSAPQAIIILSDAQVDTFLAQSIKEFRLQYIRTKKFQSSFRHKQTDRQI